MRSSNPGPLPTLRPPPHTAHPVVVCQEGALLEPLCPHSLGGAEALRRSVRAWPGIRHSPKAKEVGVPWYCSYYFEGLTEPVSRMNQRVP